MHRTLIGGGFVPSCPRENPLFIVMQLPVFMRNKTVSRRTPESGQSMVELAIGLPFLMLIIIALIEMGLIFATYVSLINATREGAIFASMHPELVTTTQYDCTLSANSGTIWCQYQARVKNEVFVATAEQLRSAQLLNYDPYTAVVANAPTLPDGNNNPGSSIQVQVTANLSTFTSNISLPFFGRFGLPNTYSLSYTFQMPIR